VEEEQQKLGKRVNIIIIIFNILLGYFQLFETQEIKYYEKEGGIQKGSIPLSNSLVFEDYERKRYNCFQIVTPKRIYYLQAESTGEMRDW